MKGLHLSTLWFVVAACSASAKQDSTDPTPKPGVPAANGDPSGTPTVTPRPPTPTGSQPTPTPSKPPTVCPSLQIKAPDAVSAGQAARINLIVTDPGGTPTYNWAVSGGSIESGQGTTSISVGTRGLGGSSVTATVELGGLPEVCTTRTATATVLVGA